MAPADYVFVRRCRPVKDDGLPHSDIPGSKPYGGSPRLVAALCVLLRLLMPRHPSCARIRLARNLLEPLDLDIRVVILFNLQLPLVKEHMSLKSMLEKAADACGRRFTIVQPDPLRVRRADLLRKEVIQPLVPQRLPCYDFIPITTHTLGRQMPDFGCRRLS